jgi:Carboxypeptidase regulatory-like domain/TonB dependent receptor-like, beta-barrel
MSEHCVVSRPSIARCVHAAVKRTADRKPSASTRTAIGFRLATLIGRINFRRLGILTCLSVFVCLSLAATGFAQQTSGTIAGTVIDPSGAVVPGVGVTATNQSTGLTRTTSTNTHGQYRIPYLPVGTYTVRTSKEGFVSQEQKGITLEILQVRSVDFSLQLGSVTQTVTVTGQTPLLETQTSEAGQVIRGSQVTNLPLNVRQFMQLAFLAPMAVPATGDFRSNEVNRGTPVPATVGQRPEQNDYQIDGIDNREAGRNSFAISPPLDSVQEFKVQTGMAPAEFRGGGTTINVVTKSGTNSYHGSVYEFLRNDLLDARPFFSNAKSPLKRNQFGVAVGGPVKKDKVFLFGNYEGYREAATGNPPVGKVFTPDERNGVFTSTIIDPSTGQPFSNNTIPQIDPISANILKLVPQQNNPSDPARNFIYNGQPSGHTDRDIFVVRGDFNQSAKNTVYGTYLFDQENATTPPTLPPPANSGGRNFHLRAQGATLHWDHVFTPTLINSFNVGYTKYHNILATLNSFNQNLIQPAGITNTLSATDPLFWAAPSVSISGYLMPSEVTPNYRTTELYDAHDSIMWSHGKHNIKFGGELRWTREWMFYTGGNGSTGFADKFTGNNVADFLLGLPSSVSKTARATQWNSTVPYLAGYVQDDWRLTPKLTLNLGLRYEVEGALRQSGNCGVGFDTVTGTLLISQHCVVLPEAQSFYQNIRPDVKIATYPENTPYNTDTNNFGPRFGFAYRALAKTVVRGGYGMFYDSPQIESLASTNDFPPDTLRPIWTSDPTIPTLTYNPEGSTSAEQTLVNAPLTIFPFISRNFPYGKIQEWNLTIEEQITPSLVASVIYQGSHTVNLLGFDNVDYRAPGPGTVQPQLRYPSFARVQNEDMWGQATFNGVSFRVEQRPWHGLSYLAQYTFSKSIDDASTLNEGPQWTDPFNRHTASGPSEFNVPNRFSIAYQYDLPVGQGKFIGRGFSGPVNKLLGGWGVRGITVFQSGLPQSPGMSLSRVGICAAACSARPDRVGNGNLPKSVRTINHFYDVTAFQLLPAGGVSGRVGNAGRGILIGPGINNFDLEVVKDTHITETQRMQFSWEMFNAWNHPQFTNPSTNLESPSTFGVISGTQAPRIMQFALQYIF